MMIEPIKTIIENYLNNRQLTAIVEGTFNGEKVVLNEKAYIPNSLLKGNLKAAMRQGDKVKLLRNDGGSEYYILEIIGVPVRLEREDTNEKL